MKNNIHSIPENSCLFNGHKFQYFTGKSNEKNFSFRIKSNFFENEKDSELNIEKYRSSFSKDINGYTALRIADGADFHQIRPNDIKVAYIKLISDPEDISLCGYFEVHPPTALCKKDGCNHYFEIKKGRKCGHKNTDPWEQFTFISVCDVCGWVLPLHYSSNIYHDCKKCGTKKSLSRLWWPVGKDDVISSYKVRCIKCGGEESLFLMPCRHFNKQRGMRYSNAGPHRFRAVTTKAQAIVHPSVKTFPDIPAEDETDKKSGKRTIQAKLLTEAFIDFFGNDIEEAKLYLYEFEDHLLKEEKFWKLPKINYIIDDIFYGSERPSHFGRNQFLTIIKRILKNAKIEIQDNAEREMVLNKYGIDFIKKSLNSLKDYDFDEFDLQGINLLHAPNQREMPKTFSADLEEFYNEFGIEKISHFPNITMIQALLGIIWGSTRNNPLLFETIQTGKFKKKEKPTVYIRDFPTEGILFKLDYERILNWLKNNEKQIMLISPINDISILPSNGKRIDIHYRDLMLKNWNCKQAVKKLLHTYSHMLIHQSTIDTGLEITSISEIIYPDTASIFIYSTNPINIGGLEYTYDYHLEDWFSRMKELANDCPQDPACMIDERGACNACSYLPEFVCHNFNLDIDRSTLVGGSDRFIRGYLYENQS